MAIGARGILRSSRGRQHGDPFPLPVPCRPRLEDRSMLPRYLAQRRVRTFALDHRVSEAAVALNALASHSVRGGFRLDRRPAASSTQPTSTQAAVLDRIRRSCARYGRQPADLAPRGALLELLHTNDMYAAAPCRVAPFDAQKLKILQKKFVPKPLCSLAPPEVVSAFSDLDRYIRRSDEEVQRALADVAPLKPYWDRRLATERDTRIEFVKQLAERGLVSYRRRIRSRVGLFFVEKKGDQIRLVVDAREASRLHHSPPHVALGSAGALAELDLSKDALDACGVTASAPEVKLFGGSLDLSDSFYQFMHEPLGEDFGIDFPEPASVYGASRVWENGEWFPVDPGEPVFPVFCALPMGWSWSLWAVHSTVAHIASDAIGSQEGLVLDKAPPRTPSAGKPAIGVYVDNVNVLGMSCADVDHTLERISDALHAVGIDTHEHVKATTEFQAVGVCFDGHRLLLHHTPRRAWRLYLAITEVLSRGRLFGWQLRILLGHMVHHCLLQRPALAVLQALYRFAFENLHVLAELPPAAIVELQVFKGLVFLAVVDLAAPLSDTVYCSDSSATGYALHLARVHPSELRPLAEVRERWRFLPVERRPVAISAPTFTPGWDATWKAPPGLEAFGGSPSSLAIATGLAPHTGPPSAGRDFVLAELPDRVPPLPDALLEPRRWALIVEGAWAKPAPIHILEGRIALAGLRHHARVAHQHGQRVLSLGDNMAELLASEKGRAVDRALCSITAHSAAYQIGCGLRWRRRFVDTLRNISDEGSRRAQRGFYAPGQRRVGTAARLGRPAPARRSPEGLAAAIPPSRPRRSGRACRELPPCPVVTHVQHCARGPWLADRTAPTLRSSPAARAAKRVSVRICPVGVRLSGRESWKLAWPAGRRCFIEIFAGCARLSGAVADAGVNLGMPWDLKLNGCLDVLVPANESLIRWLISTGRAWFVHFGTPCTPWSTARRSRVGPVVDLGLRCARFTVRMLTLCQSHHVEWSLENPASSRLFDWSPLRTFFQKYARCNFVLDMCAYGAPYRKSTRIVSSYGPLVHLACRCPGNHQHEHLQGTVQVVIDGRTQRVWRSTLASSYPPQLCTAWAEVLQAASPALARRQHGDPRVLGDWQALLRSAGKCSNEAELERLSALGRDSSWPSCPRRWVPLWPADAPQWGRRLGPRLPAAAAQRPPPGAGSSEEVSARRRPPDRLPRASSRVCLDPGPLRGLVRPLRGGRGQGRRLRALSPLGRPPGL